MDKTLSDFAEEEGFKSIGSAPNLDTLPYHLKRAMKEKNAKGLPCLVLHKSQIRGSAPEYMIYILP